MFDILLKGGTIMDGTGAPAWIGDIGILDGRVISIGSSRGEDAGVTLDITGKVVAPGFVDIHTHYDAQAFWDPTLSPSPLHGVTTVMGGNCGFSIAPLDAQDADYLLKMLARVEGMPVDTLAAGVPWDWSTTAEFLDRLDGTLVPNAGFLVGHSALRLAVMHSDANRRTATDAEIEAMKELLRAGLAAGGMGLSSTYNQSHNDHLGGPVPSRYASGDELVALCSVVGEFPGTTLEFIAPSRPMAEDAVELMAAMSAAANRPLNWNLLAVYGDNAADVRRDLDASNRAARLGGRLVALSLPGGMNIRLNFETGVLLDTLPGWVSTMALPHDEKLAFLRDPERSAWLEDQAKGRTDAQAWLENWDGYIITATHTDALTGYAGRSVGEIALDSGRTSWQTLVDIVVADDLRTVISPPNRGDDDAVWRRRLEAWRDRRTVVGGSDSGAHLDVIDSFSFSTTLLGSAVRERNLLPMEEAVSMLTDVPARLYGLRDRGRIDEGWIADLVVFDPSTIGPGPVEVRSDLPADGARIYGEGIGIDHVFVNGVEAVRHGKFTGARSGRIIRSGRDTDTVEAT